MPPIDSTVLSLLAAAATVMVQLVKGLLADTVKQYLPLILFVILVPLGTALAFYYGRDPVAGALEGFFGFAASVGFYETASNVPGARSVFNGRGWIIKSAGLRR